MKKFVSMFLAVCALSSMSVNAFAQQADAINVTSDEKLKLSFGEETFSELLLPGETYTYPLYIEQEDGKVVPLTDEHLENVRIRTEMKNGICPSLVQTYWSLLFVFAWLLPPL